jgi:branched-chain amino acid transport system substrate-binding protein
VFISAISGSNAVRVTEQIASALPHARIFAGAGIAQSAYVSPTQGGIPLVDDPRVLITSPALGWSAYPPAARSFEAAFTRSYGSPQPDAILGYESMQLMLSAIRDATDGGRRAARRSAVVSAIFNTHDRHSLLGTYSIDASGDTTMTSYGVWRVVSGSLRFWKALEG